MDLSELIAAQQGGNDLNENLAALNPAGESVFSKPFGAATAFRTPTGAVRVAFVFDPHASYDEFAILASIDTDYMDIVREELSKYLLNESELAPRKSTEKDVVWESIKKNLPMEVLSKSFFSKEENLNEYLDMIKSRARAVFKEDELLWQKLQTETFSFSLKIAIDAFYNKNLPPNRIDGEGILTIRIDGGANALSNVASVPTPAAPVAPSPKPGRKKAEKQSGAASAAETRKEDAQTVAILVEQLHMTEDEDVIVREKKFPESTDDFFDAVTKWFSVVVATRARKLETTQGTNPGLYQQILESLLYDR